MTAPQNTPPRPNALADCVEQLKLFVPAFTAGAVGQYVVELRALNVPRHYGKPLAEAGFFDLLSEEGKRGFWNAVKGYVSRPETEQPDGVYLTMNPLDRAFLGRANNAMGKIGVTISCNDQSAVRRHWLVVDVDPKRISGVSSTDAEKAAALPVIDRVRDELRARGFAEPMFCDSGNGYHLWYRIDLPPDDGKLVERTLKALAARCDTATATVDTSVFNPSRIMKVPGTWARKGSNTSERPHRMARVLEGRNLEACHVPSHTA